MGHIKRDCRNQKKIEDDAMNAMAVEIHDALFLVVHSSVDHWFNGFRGSIPYHFTSRDHVELCY